MKKLKDCGMELNYFIKKFAIVHMAMLVFATPTVLPSRTGASLFTILQECIQTSDIKVISQDKSNPIPNIIQSHSAYRAVMQCIEQRKNEFKKSTDPVRWFIGHVFRLETALELETQSVQLFEHGHKLDCVEPMAEPPTFLATCVNITKRYITPVKKYIDSTGYHNESDLQLQLCRRIGYALTNTCDFENNMYTCGNKDGSNHYIAEFLRLFFANPCTTSSASSFDPMPRVLSCIEKYTEGFHMRTKKLHQWIHLSELSSYLTNEMEVVCRQLPGTLSCAKDTVASSDIILDKIAKSLLGHGNFNRIAEYACSKFVPEFNANAACVLDSFQRRLITSAQDCLVDTGDEFFSAFHNWTFISIYHEPTQVCRKLRTFHDCMLPIFASCDKELTKIFHDVMNNFVKSCEDPTHAWLHSTGYLTMSSMALISAVFLLPWTF